MASALTIEHHNVATVSSRAPHFREQKRRHNDQPGLQRFLCIVWQTNRGSFKYFQIKTHVQTAREAHDLNMDFGSFDNGFEQLCITNFMQEYSF